MQCPADIRVVIKLRLKNGRAYPGPRREMRDDIESLAVKQLADSSGVSEVELMDPDVLDDGRQIVSLRLRIIKIVEVIENCDFVTGSQQFLNKVRTNKPRSARDQSSHRASVKMKPRAGKGRTTAGAAFLLLAAFVLAFTAGLYFRFGRQLWRLGETDPAFRLPSPRQLASLPTAQRFDFPIGSEGGALTYNAQPFTENRHLGDDLNGIGGENSDLGDQVYAIADGRVWWAGEGGPGWGNVLILL